jgi:transcriptional regulator with XRE-family HTH domain
MSKMRERRRERKLTLVKLAAYAGTGIGWLSMAERGLTVLGRRARAEVCRVLELEENEAFDARGFAR